MNIGLLMSQKYTIPGRPFLVMYPTNKSKFIHIWQPTKNWSTVPKTSNNVSNIGILQLKDRGSCIISWFLIMFDPVQHTFVNTEILPWSGIIVQLFTICATTNLKFEKKNKFENSKIEWQQGKCTLFHKIQNQFNPNFHQTSLNYLPPKSSIIIKITHKYKCNLYFKNFAIALD